MSLRKSLRNEKGLTLIELLAVIIILAIIAAIAVPTISAVIKNTRDKAILSDIVAFVNSAEIAVVDGTCEDLECTYAETDFSSDKFTGGTVDFTEGKSPENIKIKVNVEADQFEGRNAETFAEKVTDSAGITKKDLLELLN